MKIGITGSNGFIGSHLLRRLEKEKISYKVFDKEEHNLSDPKTLIDFIDTCDLIVHLAAKNIDTNENIIKNNTLGTLCLMEALKKFSSEKRIIFLSSFQVYSKKSLYGLSKRFAEHIIEYYSKNTVHKGTILRISNVYGPGCRPFYNSVVATFVHLIKKNQSLKINGDGSQKRDYLFVDDAVDAILKSIETKQKNKIEYFDICSGRLSSLKEIINDLEKIADKKVDVDFNTSVFAGEEIKERNYKKADRLLKWQPKFSLEEGLRKTYA